MSRYDPDYVKMVANQRHKEFFKEAEQSRLLKAAWPRRPRGHRTWPFRVVTSRFRTQVVEWILSLRCTVRASIARNPCN
jgi:hypothetical protein